jgi:hypothetical protein
MRGSSGNKHLLEKYSDHMQTLAHIGLMYATYCTFSTYEARRIAPGPQKKPEPEGSGCPVGCVPG